MNTFQKVNAGDRMRISARTWNAVMDASQEALRKIYIGPREPSARDAQAFARNEGPAAIPFRAPVAFSDEPLFTPRYPGNDAQRVPTPPRFPSLNGKAISKMTHENTARWGVAARKIDPNQVGPVIISGPVAVRVAMGSLSHGYVNIEQHTARGEPFSFKSSHSGIAKILCVAVDEPPESQGEPHKTWCFIDPSIGSTAPHLNQLRLRGFIDDSGGEPEAKTAIDIYAPLSVPVMLGGTNGVILPGSMGEAEGYHASPSLARDGDWADTGIAAQEGTVIHAYLTAGSVSYTADVSQFDSNAVGTPPTPYAKIGCIHLGRAHNYVVGAGRFAPGQAISTIIPGQPVP